MAFVLTSLLKTHIYDETGSRVSVALQDDNGILKTLTSLLPRTDSLVVVANDPRDFEDNDAKVKTVAESFDKTGLPFKTATVLDERNMAKSAAVISSADLIILSGGKCTCQNTFFKAIGLKKLLQSHKGVIVGVSAGTMNLCKTVANFPEEPSDLSDPRWLDGMGFFDGIIIPHFDGATQTYELPCDELNVVGDYILPMSYEKDFIGLPNASYIVIDNSANVSYHGDVYGISKGAVIKLF